MNKLKSLLGFLKGSYKSSLAGRPQRSPLKRKRRPAAGRARVTDAPQRGLGYVPKRQFSGPVAEGMRRGKAAAMKKDPFWGRRDPKDPLGQEELTQEALESMTPDERYESAQKEADRQFEQSQRLRKMFDEWQKKRGVKKKKPLYKSPMKRKLKSTKDRNMPYDPRHAYGLGYPSPPYEA